MPFRCPTTTVQQPYTSWRLQGNRTFALAAFFALCTVIHLPTFRAGNSPLVHRRRLLRQKLTTPLHVATSILSAVWLAAVPPSPGIEACTPGPKGLISAASIVLPLLWPALHLHLAALPLSIVMPVQVVITAIIDSSTRPYCAHMVSECPQAGRQYSELYNAANGLFSSFPLCFPDDAAFFFLSACTSLHMFAKVSAPSTSGS